MGAHMWYTAQGDDKWQEIQGEWLNERSKAYSDIRLVSASEVLRSTVFRSGLNGFTLGLKMKSEYSQNRHTTNGTYQTSMG
jgi:hypothetical protein